MTRPTEQLGSSDLGCYEARARAGRELAVDLSSRGQSSTEMYRLDLAPKESYQLGFRCTIRSEDSEVTRHTG